MEGGGTLAGVAGRLRRLGIAKGATVVAVAAGLLVSSGCGGDAGTVTTDDPERAFAPLVTLDHDEPWRPMGVDWFLARAAFGFAEDEGCPNRKIAVGRRLAAQRTPRTDWIHPEGLGRQAGYWRESYDGDCEAIDGARHYANEHTRPFDGNERARRLRLREGYYLDLMDWARGGPPLRRGKEGELTARAPAYVERQTVGRAGERRLELTYWMLYGMNEETRRGESDAPAHEGDWERVDVLLAVRGDDEYEPLAVRLHAPEGARTVTWDSLAKIADDGGDATHPALTAARGTHGLRPVDAERCGDCPRWRTWATLAQAAEQPWYGFGGAWGEVGDDSSTTGPIGPYEEWQTGEFQAPPEHE